MSQINFQNEASSQFICDNPRLNSRLEFRFLCDTELETGGEAHLRLGGGLIFISPALVPKPF